MEPSSFPPKSINTSDSNAQPANDSRDIEGFAEQLNAYSLEAIVEIKLQSFLDRIGEYHPGNLHSLIMQKVEQTLLINILRRTGGNQVQAAKMLGINRNTLRKKIKAYNLVP